MSGSIELAGEDYGNLMQQIASLEAEVAKLKKRNAELEPYEAVADATVKLRATLLHFTLVVVDLEERYRLPLARFQEATGCATPEEARERIAKQCAELQAALNAAESKGEIK